MLIQSVSNPSTLLYSTLVETISCKMHPKRHEEAFTESISYVTVDAVSFKDAQSHTYPEMGKAN